MKHPLVSLFLTLFRNFLAIELIAIPFVIFAAWRFGWNTPVYLGNAFFFFGIIIIALGGGTFIGHMVHNQSKDVTLGLVQANGAEGDTETQVHRGLIINDGTQLWVAALILAGLLTVLLGLWVSSQHFRIPF